MKFYIATRFSRDHYRNMAIDIKQRLEALGHNMTFDWMNGKSIKPYSKNPKETSKVAKQALDAVIEADFFIFIPEPGGTGMYVEYGAAITQYERTGKPQIYILGAHRDCVLFNFHPVTIWKQSFDELIEDLK